MRVIFIGVLLSLLVGCATNTRGVPTDSADTPTALTKSTFTPTKGVVFLFVNWGRAWNCGRFENAQLQAISFVRLPYSGQTNEILSLEPFSTLGADDKWIPYAYVIEPGEYGLVEFDLKVAKSVTDVRHLKPTTAQLFKDNKPDGGTFNVAAGEIVYIGNFWVDCTTPDPIPWRYFDTRDEFISDVENFRERYPFTKDIPIQYRLFTTKLIGQMYGVEEYSVK